MGDEWNELLAARAQAYASNDRDLYLDIGFFISNFAFAELALTSLMGRLIGQREPAVTALVFEKATAGSKAKTFKKLANAHGGIGPNLLPIWKSFEDKSIPLRNKVAHLAFSVDEVADKPTYWGSDLGSLPWDQFGTEFEGRTTLPVKVEGIELFASGNWLRKFALIMMHVGRNFSITGRVELDNIDATDTDR